MQSDPSLVLFQGKYYLFPSMTAGFLASDDLVDWTFHRLNNMPVYDYAPDVRVIGDYLYFSASHASKNCSFLRYGDWPLKIEQERMNPWSDPEWMLLSYGKPVKTSSSLDGKDATNATDENVQTCWKAASSASGEWLEVDLNLISDVYAIQINFADDQLKVDLPDGAVLQERRFIDDRRHYTRWVLEGSVDGKTYFVIEDKSEAETDLSHDLIVRESGMKARYIRCTVKELPFDQHACISGLRVFGIGEGTLPKQIHMVFGINQLTIKALVKGQPVYVRVDAFNESGISEGEVYKAI